MRRLSSITVSPGNKKLGSIPSFSLLPIVTCPSRILCAKDCYAARMCKFRSSVATSWSRNTLEVKTNIDNVFSDLNAWLGRNRPEFFRIHVGGDFITYEYFERWKALCALHPGTRFLAFSKAEFCFKATGPTDPGNLTLIVSNWPGDDANISVVVRRLYPQAWVRIKDTPDSRIPEDALSCSGNCETCHDCWNLKPGGSVVFDMH